MCRVSGSRRPQLPPALAKRPSVPHYFPLPCFAVWCSSGGLRRIGLRSLGKPSRSKPQGFQHQYAITSPTVFPHRSNIRGLLQSLFRKARGLRAEHEREGGGLRDPNNIKPEKFCACRRRRGCQLEEAETSVRRRFVGSFRTRYGLAGRRLILGGRTGCNSGSRC